MNHSGVTPGRAAAFQALSAVAGGQFLDAAFDQAAGPLDVRDRRWARECTFGVLRLRGRLDHLLDHHLHKGITSLPPTVLDLLRLGAYQILYMAVPDYAAVAQTVEQARTVAGKGMTGLVNGVLRTLVRTGEDHTLFPDRTVDAAAFLAAWHAHPRWLVERWLRTESEQRVEALLVSNNRVPAVYLRPLGPTVDEAADTLGVQEGASGPEGLCVRLPSDVSPAQALEGVRGIIQDPAAAVVTRYTDVPDGALAADLCAAPGGKAVAMAEDAGYVVALDRSRDRLARLVETRDRLQSRVAIVVARAENPPLRAADLVLVDVPCSGTGTLRRHPDLKWRLDAESITSLRRLQRSILEGAAGVVSPGGLLVYATCTLEREENEEQVEDFLRRNSDFKMESSSSVSASLLDNEGRLKVDPREHDCDGAFAARMRRTR